MALLKLGQTIIGNRLFQLAAAFDSQPFDRFNNNLARTYLVLQACFQNPRGLPRDSRADTVARYYAYYYSRYCLKINKISLTVHLFNTFKLL